MIFESSFDKSMEKQNILYDKGLDFSIKIIKLYEYLIKERNNFVLPKQLLASGTSIGAQIAEAKGAQSLADFIAKLHISLKEAHETKYWLVLLLKVEHINQDQYNNLMYSLREIIALLISTLKTAKRGLNDKY